MRSLPREQLADFVNARSYLRCWRYSCAAPTKVATTSINWDGRFSACWLDWSRPEPVGCRDEYAYIVKQNFGGFFKLTVYNGVAANIWFSAGTDVTLTSYSSLAYACRDNGEPGTGAFVYLDLIGDTESWNLKTPDATGWDRVAVPGFNDGLVFPATSAAAWGQNLNRNWGGTLKLNYMFSEDMQAAPVGAKYYRIGITAADANGNPTGAPNYLSAGLSWDKAEPGGNVPVVLGPFSVGGQNNLYLIPFDRDIAANANINWNAGQYHGFVDTKDARWKDPTTRHLITVEVFDAAGARLRPNATPATTAGGAELAKPFVFERRYQDVGARANVPYGALTHMFWWDNRELAASIEQLIQDGVVYDEECLFLEGQPNSTFAIRYRAYHQQEMFQLAHSVTWQRGVPGPGIGGSTGALLGTASNNAGEFGFPDPADDSPTNKFWEMLRTDLDPTRRKCAFTVFVTISAKTTDGDYLGNPSITKTAAFALEIG